ncbi:MAG: major capsid protein [Taibaiella sp.]|nr:major capsid protein [Taibaiella sp.]
MAEVPVSQARALFTQDIIGALSIKPPMTTYLTGGFAQVHRDTDYLQWQTRRFSERMASPVLRGASPQVIKGNGFTQKIEQPPYFHLAFNIMQLIGYMPAFGTNNPAESAMDDLLDEVMEMYAIMEEMIERRWEYMAAQIYQTGVVSAPNMDDINFNRWEQSIIDLGSGNYWDNASVDPFAVMEQGGNFLRTYGKIGGNSIDCLMGSSAYSAFLKNPIVLSRAQKLWNELTALTMPELKDDGSTFMGQVSAGPYLVNIFVYNQFYTASTEAQRAGVIQTIAGELTVSATDNTSTPYILPYNIVLKPRKERQLFGSGWVPKLPNQMMNTTNAGEQINNGRFFAYDFPDQQNTTWMGNLKAVGMPILRCVDEVFTAKVMGE